MCIKIPTVFPLLIGGNTAGIFTFWDLQNKIYLSYMRI